MQISHVLCWGAKIGIKANCGKSARRNIELKLLKVHNFLEFRIKDTGHFLVQNLFENVHTVREEEATWSGRLPCTLLQSLPSGIPLPQPILILSCTHLVL